MKIRFLYKKEPRQFNYTPRYYDPEKEARDKRRDELLGARPSSGEYVPGEIIRSKASARMDSDRERQGKRQRTTTMRLVLMIAVIVALAFWIFM